MAQRIRDPLHNLITFSERDELEVALWNALETRPFQRLRRVKQLAFSELTFPGATHTRYSHSLGVFHIAKRLISFLEREAERAGGATAGHRAQVVKAAALLHDIGHGPFSHAFENAAKQVGIAGKRHEERSGALIRETEIAGCFEGLGLSFADEVARVIERDGPTDKFSAVVSSQFDADRLDYLQRDRLMTGTRHSAIDFEWLLENLEVRSIGFGNDDVKAGEVETFVVNGKAFYAAEAYALSLFHLYTTVYFHKATRSAEKLFAYLLVRLYELYQDGSFDRSALSDSHPIRRYFSSQSIENFLALDDFVVWGSIHQMSAAEDDCVREIAQRLRDRKLLKCIDIRKEFGESVERDESIEHDERELRIDAMCTRFQEKSEAWADEQGTTIPLIINDKAERPTYKPYSESSGPLSAIMVTRNGKLGDLADLSPAVKASGVYRVFRSYYSETEEMAKQKIKSLVEEIKREE